jgi:cyclic pyranopterin phosphate synthase
MTKLTHFDSHGQAWMVDVSEKKPTRREAVARGRITMSAQALSQVSGGRMGKGDVLGVARLAGIMAAKRTPDLIPLCHPILISGVEVDLSINQAVSAIDITARVRCTGETGVEMEALTAVSVAALTVYDMCKAVDKAMVIGDICLVQKTGGKSGDYQRREEEK